MSTLGIQCGNWYEGIMASKNLVQEVKINIRQGDFRWAECKYPVSEFARVKIY